MTIKPPTPLLFDLGGVLLKNTAFDALTVHSAAEYARRLRHAQGFPHGGRTGELTAKLL